LAENIPPRLRNQPPPFNARFRRRQFGGQAIDPSFLTRLFFFSGKQFHFGKHSYSWHNQNTLIVRNIYFMAFRLTICWHKTLLKNLQTI